MEARGISLDKHRQQIRDDFIIRQLRAKYISQAIIISPHKVEEYYNQHRQDPGFKVEEQVKLSMIVRTNSTGANAPKAREVAEDILTRLKAGASFVEMARTYNQSSHRDGDEGWVDRKYFISQLSDAAFSLKPGQYSEVIDTPNACYVLWVQESKPAHIKVLSEVRDQIESGLILDQQKNLEKQWMDRLRKRPS